MSKRKNKFPIICMNCSNSVIQSRNSASKFCTQRCQLNFQYEEFIRRWKEGKETGNVKGGQTSAHIKKYLREKYNNKCSRCSWGQINPFTNKVPVEIEHIDGDHTNNKEENIDLVCPNCHSLTPTYRALNKGKGREVRRKKEV